MALCGNGLIYLLTWYRFKSFVHTKIYQTKSFKVGMYSHHQWAITWQDMHESWLALYQTMQCFNDHKYIKVFQNITDKGEYAGDPDISPFATTFLSVHGHIPSSGLHLIYYSGNAFKLLMNYKMFNPFSAMGKIMVFCGRHRSRSDCTERAVWTPHNMQSDLDLCCLLIKSDICGMIICRTLWILFTVIERGQF